MILTINDQISIPVSHFMDSLSSNKEQGIIHCATVNIDTAFINQEIIEQLNEPIETNVLNLILRNDEKIVWASSTFNYMEYNFEITKNDGNFEEKQTINFLIR